VAPVGSSPGDVSVEGVFDLNASVSELTADLYNAEFYSISPYEDPVSTSPGTYNPMHVNRGDNFMGSSAQHFDLDVKTAPSWMRLGYMDVGFRCAREGEVTP
jgi:formylglycine-generating enzyme required for sulfatase activity